MSRFSCPVLPASGSVGSRVSPAAGETAHSPAPALAPNNAASPSPLAFIRRVTWQPPLETSPSLPPLSARPPAGSSNRPFARQLEGWGGGEV